MRGKIIKLTLCICPSLFETCLNNANYVIYDKLSRVFVAGFRFRGEIKPPGNFSNSYRPFFSCTESPWTWSDLFQVFRLDITFAREVCPLGIKIKKIWQSSYSFHYPQWQNARANVMANLSNLYKLPNTRIFVAAENGSVEVLELVALFVLKTETFDAKLFGWEEYF